MFRSAVHQKFDFEKQKRAYHMPRFDALLACFKIILICYYGTPC